MDHPRRRELPTMQMPVSVCSNDKFPPLCRYVKPSHVKLVKTKVPDVVLIETHDKYVLDGDAEEKEELPVVTVKANPRTNMCRRSCASNCQCGVVSTVKIEESGTDSCGESPVVGGRDFDNGGKEETESEDIAEGQSQMTASSDDLPHAADEGRRTDEITQDRRNRPEPKRIEVVASEASEIGEEGSRQGHALEEETQNDTNECTMSTLKDMGIGTDEIVHSLCKILGVGPEHPQVRKLLGIDTAKPKERQGRWVGRAWVNCLEVLEDEEAEILATSTEEYPEVEFEVALDSGSVVHVCANADTLGYVLEESPGSRRGQQFLMGDGGKLGNQGQKVLKLGSDQCSDITSTFQIADVTRPLMSVGKICDEGLTVEFSKTRAIVVDKNGKTVCIFERQPGGLYVAKMKLRAPGFVRQ